VALLCVLCCVFCGVTTERYEEGWTNEKLCTDAVARHRTVAVVADFIVLI